MENQHGAESVQSVIAGHSEEDLPVIFSVAVGGVHTRAFPECFVFVERGVLFQ